MGSVVGGSLMCPDDDRAADVLVYGQRKADSLLSVYSLFLNLKLPRLISLTILTSYLGGVKLLKIYYSTLLSWELSPTDCPEWGQVNWLSM